MRRPLSLATLALVTTLWSAAIVAAPAGETPRLSALTYAAGAMVCHQRPERSFHRGAAQYPVCARCFGLYTGAVAGVAAWALIAGVRPVARTRALHTTRNFRRVLILAAVPTIVTVATAAAGWWDASGVTRAVLAFPLGAAIAAVVTAAATGDLR